MKTFRDNAGREWSLRIDVAALRRVRDGTDCNLGDVRKLGELVQQLRVDDLFVAEVAWCCCRPQAEAQKIDADSFYAAMAGDATGAAYGAIVEGLSDFFRDPEVRRTLRRLIGTLEQTTKQILATMEQPMQNTTSGASSIATPAFSDLTPQA